MNHFISPPAVYWINLKSESFLSNFVFALFIIWILSFIPHCIYDHKAKKSNDESKELYKEKANVWLRIFLISICSLVINMVFFLSICEGLEVSGWDISADVMRAKIIYFCFIVAAILGIIALIVCIKTLIKRFKSKKMKIDVLYAILVLLVSIIIYAFTIVEFNGYFSMVK